MLVICEPQITTDAPALENKEPTFDLGLGCHGRQTASKREVLRFAVLGQTPELDPHVSHASLVASKQQVPGHFFSWIAIGFDARWLELCIEKEGQRKRQNLGFACAIIATQ